MKTNNIILLALVAALALSCSVREDDMHVMGGTVSFKATLADAPFTKTVLQSDGSVYWSPGDAVNLFYGATGSTRLESDNTEAAAQVNFTGTLEGFVPDGSSYFWAVYPYDEANSFDGSAVTLTLPAVQTAVAGTFADDLFVTMAHSKDYTLQFYNVCGGVKFSVAGEGIKYVTFKGNSDEVLAGKVKVGLDEEGKPQVKEVVDGKKEIRVDAPGGGTFETGKWYYVVAFPDTLASGYTMSFYDDKLLAERVENSSVILKRSVWGKLTEADDVNITATRWLAFGSEGTTTISLSNTGGNAPKLYYSYDKTEWTQWDYSALTFTSSDTLYLGGDNPGGFSSGVSKYSKFVADGSNYCVSGDIMSLLNKKAAIKVIPNENCFGKLFYNSTILKTAPKLEATTLTYNCYELMFSGCTGLTAAPDLPATTLAINCYCGMFAGCTSLTAAPDLPATTLAIGCYMDMFMDCTNLTAAPVLPATTLANYCYSSLFRGCDKLNYVKCLATNIDAQDCTDEWLLYVSSSGTFVKAPEMDKWTLDSPSGIPDGWTAEDNITASNYLTLTSEGTTNLKLTDIGGNKPKLYYSYDKTNWTEWDHKNITFTSSSPLYLCGDNTSGFNFTSSQYSTFSATGSLFDIDGSIMSLLDKDNTLAEIPCDSCFIRLFNQCSLLHSAPDLPATTLKSACYRSMFYSCTNLSEAPELPATIMKPSCYSSMFMNCTSLIEAPELKSTTLASACYEKMFSNCSNLVTPPDLAAEKMEYYCYAEMFKGTNLTQAPGLPATDLAEGCYSAMFYNCESLTGAPDLIAMELKEKCYYAMFHNCKSMETAPDLPAPTLEKECYRLMFSGCSKLNYVKCLATNIEATNCTANWLDAPIAQEGTFFKAATMNDWLIDSPSGIPEGWTVDDAVTASKYLTFASEGTTTISLNNLTDNAPVLYYSYDKTNWAKWDYSALTFTSTDTLYICGSNPSGFSSGFSKYSNFVNSGSKYSVSGDVMSLLNKDAAVKVIPNESCFYHLFNSCTGLTAAPELPATTLAADCYEGMFWGCTGLTTAPELPATTLASNCYVSMFSGCTGLTTAPELKAISLAYNCYSAMFVGCTGLTAAPDLPATTLAINCYCGMFAGCTGLTTAPELKATSLAGNCYISMFSGCTNLTTAPKLSATTLAEACYYLMFKGCTSLTTAPELPATTLAANCYRSMFNGCNNLNYLKCMATNISADDCVLDWLEGVAETGTFVKDSYMTEADWRNTGIPEGWDVVNAE